MQRGRSTAPCMECSESQVVTVTTWLLSWVVSSWGRLFFLAISACKGCKASGGPVCRRPCFMLTLSIYWRYFPLSSRSWIGWTAVCTWGQNHLMPQPPNTDTTNRHNTWTAEYSKTNTWTEHLFIFLSLGSKVTPNHRISGFSSICKWSRQILLYNGGFAPPPSPVQIWRKKWSPKGAQQCR